MDSPTSSVSSISPTPMNFNNQIRDKNRPIELLIDFWKDDKCKLPYEVPILLSHVDKKCVDKNCVDYDVQYILEHFHLDNTTKNGLRMLKYLYKKYKKHIPIDSDLEKAINNKLRFIINNKSQFIEDDPVDILIYNEDDDKLIKYIEEDCEYETKHSYKYNMDYNDDHSSGYE